MFRVAILLVVFVLVTLLVATAITNIVVTLTLTFWMLMLFMLVLFMCVPLLVVPSLPYPMTELTLLSLRRVPPPTEFTVPASFLIFQHTPLLSYPCPHDTLLTCHQTSLPLLPLSQCESM